MTPSQKSCHTRLLHSRSSSHVGMILSHPPVSRVIRFLNVAFLLKFLTIDWHFFVPISR